MVILLYIRMTTTFHNKNFALSLALKRSQARTRKWPMTKICAEMRAARAKQKNIQKKKDVQHDYFSSFNQ